MKTILFIILFVAILIVACMFSWHYGEHHELHKIRAEFDNVLKHLGPSSRFRQGLETAEKIVDVMDADWNGNYVESKEDVEDESE